VHSWQNTSRGVHMDSVIIRRVSTNLRDGTFGVMLWRGDPICVTLEETWLDNIPRESCIPAGSYECRKYSGTKYKDVWEVRNVPQRTAILIHWGNTERNTAGCILVGKYFAQFGEQKGIADSVKTFAMLRNTLPDRFTLHIEDCF
jgi:hypothetical protein